MRFKSIDFLRFIAVFLVLLRHFNEESSAQIDDWVYELIYKLQTIGWIGVDLFFVISGFLVSGLIFSELDHTGKFDWLRFFWRRGFKIYPSFYFLILASSIYFLLKGRLNLDLFFHEIVYLQNYFVGLWNHTWSLAVEEHFYILLAFLFYVVSKLRFNLNQSKFGLFLLFILISLAVVKALYASEIVLKNRSQYFTHWRIDSLLFGVFICYMSRYQPIYFKIWQSKFALLLVILLTPLVFMLAASGFYDVI